MSKLTILLDAGHTSDYAREHPAQFTGVDWASGKAGEIARTLGFARDTHDSVEHLLNVAVARAVQLECNDRGIPCETIDWPALGNDAEITKVVNYANAHQPTVLVSLHGNASGGAGWRGLSCKATGSVVLHYQASARGKDLAKRIAAHLWAVRQRDGGPDNRASHTTPSSVAVLRRTAPVAVLVETCFYDSLEDLYWTVTHLRAVACAIVDGVKEWHAVQAAR